MIPVNAFRFFTSRIRTRFRNSTTGIVLILIATAMISACSRTSGITVQPETDELQEYLALIDGSPLEIDEFLGQFNRSASLVSPEQTDSLAEYRDFLDRYVDFRLKVLEARAAGYAELPEMKSEIIQYRNQLARPYLLKSEVTDPLIREFYERRKVMVSASHILLRVPGKANPTDTLSAFRKLSLIADSVEAGIDFGDLAFRNSEDPSASGVPDNPGYRGYLGFFGSGKMVYEFENAAYETDPGKASSIFRTQFGYHLVFVHERRPFPADLRIAHIMIRPAARTPADSAAARSEILDLKKKIEEGEDFATLAKTYSADTFTARNGGEMQRAGYDSGLPVSMRDAAFSLELNAVSDVVESPFGYHLIKMLEKYPEKTLEESREDIQARISKLPRVGNAEQAWKQRIREESGFKIDSTYLSDWSLQYSYPGKSMKDEVDDSVLVQHVAWLGDTSYSMRDFIAYLDNGSPAINRTNQNEVLNAADQFILEMVVEQEIVRLETYDDDFALTMREFERGLLLFRLMEDSVWTAAGNDSLGLRQYYDQHSESYWFEDRTRVISFTTKNEVIAKDLVSEIRSLGYAEPVVAEIRSDSTSSVRIDTTLVESETNSVYDRIQEIPWDAITDPVEYNNGYIVLYNDGPDPARLRTYEEARALVVNGYQEVLEKRLLERLHMKYSARVYPENLDLLLSRQ